MESISMDAIKNAKGRTYFNYDGVAICVEDFLEYKAVDKELGIGFITLIKALKQKRVWIKIEDFKFHTAKIVESPFELELYADKDGKILCWLWFEEYGKQVQARTYGELWALTKGELE